MAPANLKILLTTLLQTALVSVVPAGDASSSSDWNLIWSDEFEYSGAPDPEKWGYDLGAGGGGNGERQVYTDELENARVENGSLLIQAVQTNGDTRAPTYTSARLVTREKKSIQYGRVEVRAIMPNETGTWAAIWMLPTDALFSDLYWPNNGEIDIVEHVGYEQDPLSLQLKGVNFLNNLHSTIHSEKQNFLNSGGIGASTYLEEISTQFNVYAFEWFPDGMEFFINGESYLRVDRETDVAIPVRNRPDDTTPWWPFDQRFHLLMNLAVGGNWGGHFNQDFYGSSPHPIGIDYNGNWPQTMEVDYVRMYEHSSMLSEPATVVPGMINPLDYIAERGGVYEILRSTKRGIATRCIEVHL
jgi:beta-glucanase (GH16 family)|tara:strand:- start:57278 stop:58351 length:1074 start_codon:yes stop_codon:yes gene_type:complete